MSRTAHCWDNSVLESFCSSLKRRLLDTVLFESRVVARQAIFEYIDTTDNAVIRHWLT
ncbi:hypothetical protein [Deinococcus sp. QL22]|uniref:hypothetical protein n=1 Tax=Deinococcus sp. QL22 TaxID=2939437 RepID=UPI003530512E